MMQILAADVILWPTGGLPKPFGAFVPPVTCWARLTQKGRKETFHAESTPPFLPLWLLSKPANGLEHIRVHSWSVQQIIGKQSTKQESLDKFISCSKHPVLKGLQIAQGIFLLAESKLILNMIRWHSYKHKTVLLVKTSYTAITKASFNFPKWRQNSSFWIVITQIKCNWG